MCENIENKIIGILAESIVREISCQLEEGLYDEITLHKFVEELNLIIEQPLSVSSLMAIYIRLFGEESIEKTLLRAKLLHNEKMAELEFAES